MKLQNMAIADEVAYQRAYYKRTADLYDSMHVMEADEHERAMQILFANLPVLNVRTIIDIGAGTGPVQRRAKEQGIACELVGIEPVAALRERGHRAGIEAKALIGGDATCLGFKDNSFDLACEFGSLHHIRDSATAVREMCRVAKIGIFISDSNAYGQGSLVVRVIKHLTWRLGVFPFFSKLKNGGRDYFISEGDGLSYSYSVLDSVKIVRTKFPNLYFFSTVPTSSSYLGFCSPHLALLATV